MAKLLFSLVCFLLAGASLFMYSQPQYDEIKALQVKGAEYSKALDKAAELQKLKDNLLTRFNSFSQSDLDKLDKLLPDHVDNVRLVLDLDNLATQHRLSLENVAISDKSSGGGSSGSGNGAISSDVDKYQSLTMGFSVKGSYEDIKSFMKDMESSLRIVDLVSLKLGESSAAAGAAPATFSADMTIRTYWLK